MDGTGLRQLTSGAFDDYEPTYLPDGGIVFVSTRCKRWVNCWMTQVGMIYRCDADGGNIQPLSANTEHDNTPWVLPDGRILYTRWEYVDRSQVEYPPSLDDEPGRHGADGLLRQHAFLDRDDRRQADPRHPQGARLLLARATASTSTPASPRSSRRTPGPDDQPRQAAAQRRT